MDDLELARCVAGRLRESGVIEDLCSRPHERGAELLLQAAQLIGFPIYPTAGRPKVEAVLVEVLDEQLPDPQETNY